MRTDVPKLIVMLTNHDKTVEDAYDVFDACKNSDAEYFGFKEEPLPLEEMKKLYSYMKACGKKTFLEVVAYTEEECMAGAEKAVACGVDVLMGTIYFDSIHAFCKEHKLTYMPFVGKITGRPSVLGGSIEEMIGEARELLEKGVDGFDLLAYRFTGDAEELIRQFVAQVPAPVCIAGSINSFERLDSMKAAAPWAFTIGGAFFDNRFGETMEAQINTVCRYMNE